MSLKKTAKKETPHAIYRNRQGWEWRVLKTYQKPEKERTNEYARWMCAVSSPFTHGGFDMGDVYLNDITSGAELVECTEEFAEAYGIERP